jgi:hypothetical protein
VSTQRDPCLYIASALGKEVEDRLQVLVAGRAFVVVSPHPARALRQLLPGSRSKAVILGEAGFPKHVGIKLHGVFERVVVAVHLAGKEVTGELHGVGSRGLGCGEMDVASTIH